MKFNHYDLGHQPRGTVVEVALSGSAANVRLLDNSNFQSYRRGRRHHYYGGLIRRSPTRLTVPRTGHWHVTVDMQGLRGKTRSSLRIIPKEAMVTLPDYTPRSLSSLVRSVSPADRDDSVLEEEATTGEYDVFISHATEDKDEIVRPLASQLALTGLRVWYDEFELRLGDSLRRKIGSSPKFSVTSSKPFPSPTAP